MPKFRVAFFSSKKTSTPEAEYAVENPKYLLPYKQLQDEIENVGGQMLHVAGQESHLGNGVFTEAFLLDEHGFVESYGVTKFDVVFNKSNFISDGSVPVFNDPFVDQICIDKYKTYELFGQYSPKTFLINDQQELLQKINDIKTSMVVIKPLCGSEGRGVFIGPKESLELESIAYPSILQDFMDTSCGIPGVVDGYHDFRVAIYDGELLYSYVRTPPKEKFTANVAQGGTFRMIAISDIPDEIRALVEKIDQKFSHIESRFYGVDVGMTKDGPKIIELNSKLGILPNQDDPVFLDLKKRLAQTFKKLSVS